MTTQTEYYRRRAAAERMLSGLTTDPRVAAVHAELAARYDELIRDDGPGDWLDIGHGISAS